MPAWWDSLEMVASVTWYLRWIGAGLTILGALCVVATLATSKRTETLREKRAADRHLTPEQRAKLVGILNQGVKGEIAIQCVIANIESCNFAEEINAALRESGWTTAGVSQTLTFGKDQTGRSVAPTGLIILVADPSYVPIRTTTLEQALTEIGLPPRVDPLMGATSEHVGLLVGVKP